MLVATGKADIPLIDSVEAQGYEELATAIKDVMLTLAQAIVRDGEGATKFVTIRVNGGANNDECLDVAYAVAHSPLIKTALFASDPNWGRILAAVGYAGVPDLDVEKIDVYLDDVCITRQGGRAAEYEESHGAAAQCRASNWRDSVRRRPTRLMISARPRCAKSGGHSLKLPARKPPYTCSDSPSAL